MKMGSMADGYTETATSTEELVNPALQFTVCISFKFQLPYKEKHDYYPHLPDKETPTTYPSTPSSR